MLIPYTWLKEFVALKTPAEKVASDLSLSTIGVEGVESYGREKVLNLDVTYNRGDLLSVVGVARELSALYNLDFKGEIEQFEPGKEVMQLPIKSDAKLAKIYTLTRISNLAYQKTPKVIKERLEAAGMRSVNLWADLTNYAMLEWGQPFHAFDAEKVRKRDSKGEIIVRKARRGEKIKTLDGLNRKLNSTDIVIADRKGPIGIAGVMGGENTEVNEKTTEILLEAAIFGPQSIRKTARRLGLRSEASKRFEHYLSPENLLMALNKITQLFQLYGEGTVVGFSLLGESKTDLEGVTLTQEKLNAVSGTPIPIADTRKYLKLLGFKVMSSEDGLLCWAPHWRGDISIPEDLAEEVIRFHGYERLPAHPLETTLEDAPENRLETERNNVTRLLTGLGFDEVKSQAFVSTKSLIHLDSKKLLKIKNPISAETEYLRSSLILSLLEVAQQNAPRYGEGMIFELEKVYPPKDDEFLSLGALIWGKKELFREAKGYLEALLTKTNLPMRLTPGKNALLHPKRSAEIEVDGERLGVVGEIHPHLATSYGFEVGIFELNLETLASLARDWKPFAPISQYPEIYEDFSFTMAEKYALGDLMEKISKVSTLVKNVELLDRYVRKGKRSITLRVTFQSDERTISVEDVEPSRVKIQKLIKKSGGSLRS